MPTKRHPRYGSMQVWPRKRAKRETPRVRHWPSTKDAKLLGFMGYKVGMTHLIITDNGATSMTKGEDIMCPVTIIECPPIKIAGIVFYKKDLYGLNASTLILANKLDKELSKKIPTPKKIKQKIEDIKIEEFSDVKLLVHTQPKLTTIGKKKPELMEVDIGGKINEKFEYAKTNLGKEVKLQDIFTEAQQLDSHAITKGKGFQGPVKRFGISIRVHKSEKTKRGPGSLGAWHGTNYYRVPKAGQTGYHQRTDFNKFIIKISDKPEEINANAGFKRYGLIKNTYMVLKGSVQGPTKRLIVFSNALRPKKNSPKEGPSIVYVKK